jgi:glutathione-regulated potassium-efflux system ancillary protein KefC
VLVNDLGTVLALGFIFAPFTIKTFVFAGVAIVVFIILPWLTPRPILPTSVSKK